MRFRNLRIAFSATCLVACLLLIVLWVRSYWALDTVQHLAAGSRGYGVVSDMGRLIFTRFDLPPDLVNRYFKNSRWFVRHSSQADVPPSRRAEPTPVSWSVVHKQSEYQRTLFTVPYWFPLLLAVVIAAISAIALRIPWPRRFTLRTLLIATTLVALVLGLVMWQR
jgi:hypothetical protein